MLKILIITYGGHIYYTFSYYDRWERPFATHNSFIKNSENQVPLASNANDFCPPR